MDLTARKNAKTQWNRTACGELLGDKNSLEYFEAVEKDRYLQQYWMKEYFDFNKFKGKRVLEIGVGQGTDLLQFGKAGAKCYGIDITENHLVLTRRNFELHGLDIELKHSDVTNIKHEDNYFDCVYSFGVLHHIPEMSECLKEIRRVLKPGGAFYCGLYYKWSAFHLFAMILYQGVMLGNLFKIGYSGLLATIESGADGVHIKPYVKLYDKKTVRSMLKDFAIDDVSVRQLYARHFCIPLRGKRIKPLENTFGWYIVFKATKNMLTE